MKRLKFSDLNWPAGLNLHLLKEVVPEKKISEFIALNSKKSRKFRRIMLPSETCIKKVYCHFLWSEILKGNMKWSDLKNKYRKFFGSLKASKIEKREVERLFQQRENEIRNE